MATTTKRIQILSILMMPSMLSWPPCNSSTHWETIQRGDNDNDKIPPVVIVASIGEQCQNDATHDARILSANFNWQFLPKRPSPVILQEESTIRLGGSTKRAQELLGFSTRVSSCETGLSNYGGIMIAPSPWRPIVFLSRRNNQLYCQRGHFAVLPMTRNACGVARLFHVPRNALTKENALPRLR
jgi:hypothetical protein